MESCFCLELKFHYICEYASAQNYRDSLWCRWEGKLPHSGLYFEQVMDHLDKQGATELGKLYDTMVLKIIQGLETGEYVSLDSEYHLIV